MNTTTKIDSRPLRALFVTLALLAALLAALAKEIAVTLPLWVAVLEWGLLWYRRPRTGSAGLHAIRAGALFSIPAAASLGLRAAAVGLDVVDATVSGGTIAHYMPGSEKFTIRVTAEAGTGRLVGAQIVGGRGSAKRIDVFATAIWEGMSAGTLEWVDLAYDPPFAPVWDLIAIAARKTAAAAGSSM